MVKSIQLYKRNLRIAGHNSPLQHEHRSLVVTLLVKQGTHQKIGYELDYPYFKLHEHISSKREADRKLKFRALLTPL